MLNSFGDVLKKARKEMGWDQRSLGTALRMSDKTIGNLESGGRPDRPAAREVLNLMDAYEVEFKPDFSDIHSLPELRQRYFLILDFRFDPMPDERIRSITRRMRVVGMSVVRRLNQTPNTMSSGCDGVEIHVPPINRISFDTVLKKFLKDYGPSNCLVRKEVGLRLTEEDIPEHWNYYRVPHRA